MKDKDGKKHLSDKEKCNLMVQTWQDVFRITEEEDNKFYKLHSDHIDRYMSLKTG